ncbi:MAG: HD domain-containing protein [Clostridia bacterium]|nr:HD domain-containing protein [Clostridia bacterium]
MTNLEKKIRIEEVLKPGTDLETFKEVIFDLIPEFKTLDIPHDQPAHKYDIITHTYYVIQGVSNNRIVRLAALFHDIGKPMSKFLGSDGVYHYWGHPYNSYLLTKMIMTNLGYHEYTIETVTAMVRYHDTYINQNDDFFEICLREMHIENLELFCELQRADLFAHADAYANRHVEQLEKAHLDYMERVKVYL